MDIINILKKSFYDFKTSWSTLILACLPLSFLPYLTIFDRNIGLLLMLILTGPLKAGMSKISLAIVNKQPFKISDAFVGFTYFKNALGVLLLSLVFMVLGLFLFIIPGILVFLWLSQAFYILSENPSLEPMEVFKKSRDLMKGNELKYLSVFIFLTGISLLLMISNLIVLMFIITSFQFVVFANFYKDLKNN